ncbi:hydrolase/acyltransferase [Melampsora larici-populina 98AG31]|uniref:Hydrolase/acyltransferase n=1 Tax=Melampsora larici-populina (strain 98AG31 / pathotype 3-4-7) TaxID=747676 RepID=F4RFB1_MELLP|nr:hydrolase/acyltransferase [Melampsora larici-populina 98AG31]EGG08783.1 hydrolase/acyltransferase [Melampsora larici-populina 98AG31]
MMKIFQLIILLVINNVNSTSIDRRATQPWLILPPTPSLPKPISNTLQDINGVKLWSQEYNKSPGKIPIVLNHGGLGYSAYFGDVINNLIAQNRYVIAIDRRGHGRSTFNANDEFTFDMFAKDIDDQLKSIGVQKYDVLGWSDGAATTLAALQTPTLASKINKAFIFAGFMVPQDTNSTFTSTNIYTEFVSRCAKEYAVNQPTQDFKLFAGKVATLESKLPQFTAQGLGRIDGSKVAIAGAEYDEAVNLNVPDKLHSAIRGSQLIMLKGVSHFAPLQDSKGFTQAILKFFG